MPFFLFIYLIDDSWLNVDPTTLERILEDKFGELQIEAKSDILPQLNSFLHRKSDYEGMKPSSKSRKSSRKLSHLSASNRKSSTLSNASDASQISSQIGFDPDSFNSTMQGILGKDKS